MSCADEACTPEAEVPPPNPGSPPFYHSVLDDELWAAVAPPTQPHPPQNDVAIVPVTPPTQPHPPQNDVAIVPVTAPTQPHPPQSDVAIVPVTPPTQPHPPQNDVTIVPVSLQPLPLQSDEPTIAVSLASNTTLYMHCYSMNSALNITPALLLLTLDAHAQRGLQYSVCLSVCE